MCAFIACPAELSSISQKDKKIHLGFPIGPKIAKRLLDFKNLREISIPPSAKRRCTQETLELLEQNGKKIRTLKATSGRRKVLSKRQIRKARKLLQEGNSIRQVAKVFGVSRDTIWRVSKTLPFLIILFDVNCIDFMGLAMNAVPTSVGVILVAAFALPLIRVLTQELSAERGNLR